jgi:putative endonuclease
MGHRYYVYLLASKSRALYVGVTNDLILRVRQHRDGTYDGFTKQYRIDRLVYYESFGWVQDAIAREKQIKRWRREKKVFLIERENPTWEDLSEAWRQPMVVQIHTAAL